MSGKTTDTLNPFPFFIFSLFLQKFRNLTSDFVVNMALILNAF